MLTTSTLRVLGPSDLHALQALIDRDPVRHVFAASRINASGMQAWRMGGEAWGFFEGDDLTAACYAGANLVPIETSPRSLFAFAERARRLGRRCSSIVGPADEVLEMWRLLEPAWGPARDVRDRQPVMALTQAPNLARDPGVRRVREDELDLLMPACVAMFTEEVGIPPSSGQNFAAYRARVAELIRAGRAFARIDQGTVVFKAEIGAATDAACQVQGVWVDPRFRGRGIAGPAMAAVAELARTTVAPVVSLYVNDYNAAARATYRSVGFIDVDEFASVLF